MIKSPLLNGTMPAWVKWAGSLTANTAIILIALFLVWAMSTGFEETLAQHDRNSIGLLRQICINTSQTETSRAACLR